MVDMGLLPCARSGWSVVKSAPRNDDYVRLPKAAKAAIAVAMPPANELRAVRQAIEPEQPVQVDSRSAGIIGKRRRGSVCAAGHGSDRAPGNLGDHGSNTFPPRPASNRTGG